MKYPKLFQNILEGFFFKKKVFVQFTFYAVCSALKLGLQLALWILSTVSKSKILEKFNCSRM